jgi:hypothetical protein
LGTATKDNANGEFPERSKGSDCKSDGIAFAGSNPALPTYPPVPVGVPGVGRRAEEPFPVIEPSNSPDDQLRV